MREFNLESLEDWLPETARQLAEVIGFPATQALVARFGGASFPIGRGLRSTGERRLALLREVIGPEKTSSAGAAFWGRQFPGHSPLRRCPARMAQSLFSRPGGCPCR